MTLLPTVISGWTGTFINVYSIVYIINYYIQLANESITTACAPIAVQYVPWVTPTCIRPWGIMTELLTVVTQRTCTFDYIYDGGKSR